MTSSASKDSARRDDDVTIGEGRLAGKGVYAARDFNEGELVVAYNLQELAQDEFDALPLSQREWTHSFWGRIYLFPEPARYVNHSDNPSTYPDLERMGDVALRPIKVGEAITIDDSIELHNELRTFLEAYEAAVKAKDFDKISPLVAEDAEFWLTDGSYVGKPAVAQAFEDGWTSTRDEEGTFSDVEWVVATYRTSVCTYRFGSEGSRTGKRAEHQGRGTTVLRRMDGGWRIVHQHLSTPATRSNTDG
jgi:ketosteroid isomerase-like protein